MTLPPAHLPRPPYDPELALVLDAGELPDTIVPELIPAIRDALSSPPVEEILHGRAVDHELRTIAGPGGDITVSVLRPRRASGALPGVLFLHGGGMIVGDRFTFIDDALDWVENLHVLVVTVEYRRAPEHPDPAPADDAYAALLWLAGHSAELGVDAARLVVAGFSAGAGIAAGVALRARDHDGPVLLAQVLLSPMLDDRNDTVSSRQYTRTGTWSHTSNDTGWDALLGARRDTRHVSAYAVPARAADLTGLPSAFIDVGSAEVFRDEDVAYASRLWAAGVQAELHVWPGGFHGFDAAAPTAALSVVARRTRATWLARMLGPPA